MCVLNYKFVDKVAIDEIQEFVIFYKDILKGKREIPECLEIQFSENLTAIDELFYSYLLLFKQEFRQVKIVLNIPLNGATNKAFQLAKQHIVFLNAYYDENFIILKGEPALTLRNVKSNEFMPHILVRGWNVEDKKHEKSDMFLKKDANDLNRILKNTLPAKIEFLQDDVFLQKNTFSKKLKQTVPVKTISDLAYHYAIDILEELGVLRKLYLESIGEKKDYRIYSLNQTDSTRLINTSLELLRIHGFFNFSVIQIFIFSLLIKNVQFFKSDVANEYEKKNEFISEYERYLVVLLNYTKDISYGLEELAKNIVQHTGKEDSEGFGVISARIHKSDKIDLFKNKDCDFDEWMQRYEGEKCKFLDINVIDSGLKSVKTKYTENIQKEIEKYSVHHTEPYVTIVKNLKQDQEFIKNDYSFSRFLDFNKIDLLHQIRRANARLGLLIFSNLVLKQRHGIIKFSSTDLEDDECDFGYLYLKNDEFNYSRLKYDNADHLAEFFLSLGTNYNFIIPIELTQEEKEGITISQGKGTPTSVLKSLFDYQLISDYNELNNADPTKTYILDINQKEIPVCEDKYEKIYQLCRAVKVPDKIKSPSIVMINAKDIVNILSTSSDWIRFLACLQFSDQKDIIIYNIDFSIHQQIININRIYDSIEAFWNEETFVLFYLKFDYLYEHRVKVNNQTQKLSLWFCDVLHGKSFEDYLLLNRSINQYHHNLYSIIDTSVDLSERFPIEKHFNSKLFSGDKLLNFELLIKNAEGLTLFEESVQSLLNLEVCTLPDRKLLENKIKNIDRFFCKFKGYKVSNSHFRLGSKIHISDFYYAKRIFYNSFYANRFAFLVARYLLNTSLSGVSRQENISLIGYSRYSELLVSNVRRLLNEHKDGFKNINHDVVLEDNRVLKNARNLNNKVIFIIPISSTFSTSDKIKKWLDEILWKQKKPKRQNISDREPNTDINILLVANKDFENFDSENDLYKEFGWKKWKEDEKKVLEKGENDKKSFQKFFIALTTNWYSIHACKLCFPDSSEKERCLLETGANSVSPESIFGFPITRIKNVFTGINYKSYINNKESVILHKHIKRDGKHYKQYIRAGKFLSIDENKKMVQEWLTRITINPHHDNFIIITPSRTANSGFANMINEYLFSETATVLQYSNTDDILQNFIHFNSSLFRNSRIIFVDDVMRTANSFHLINDYIRSIPITRDEQQTESESIGNYQQQKRIDYCFCIFNRLSYFEETGVFNSLAKDGKIYSFIEVNVPPIEQPNFEFPDVVKENLFDDLSKDSVTDKMKIHYSELKNKVKAYDVDFNSSLPETDIKHLFNFLVCKSLYDFFSGEFKVETEFSYHRIDQITLFHENEEQILDILVKFVTQDKDVSEFLCKYSIYKFEVENRIIYNCATPAFIYYKEIKEAVFVWLEKRVKQMVKDIICQGEGEFFDRFFKCKHYDNDSGADIPSEYCGYHTLKFYLRLAVGLKMNYIFSVEMLKAIQIVMKELSHRKCEIIRYEKKQSPLVLFAFELTPILPGKDISPIGFAIYYTGLIQQIIYNEEAKAVRLVKNIVEFLGDNEKENGLNLRNNFDNQFIGLLRMLVLENTFIFTTYHKTLYQEKLLNEYVFQKEKGQESKKQFEKFTAFLEKYEGQTSRYGALNRMLMRYTFDPITRLFTKEEGDTGLKIAFQKTIYLKTLLQNEIKENRGNGNVKEKVNLILRYLCEILDISPEKCNGGAFFVLHYKKVMEPEDNIVAEDLYSIDNYSTSEEEEIKANVTSDDSLILQIFKGIKEAGSRKPKSTFEMLYNERERRYDSVKITSYKGEPVDINHNYIEAIKDQGYNNLFFLRISEIKEEPPASTSSESKFGTNPQAVICFYKCNLKTCQQCSYRQDSYCNRNECKEEKCDKKTCDKEKCYKRFDPKRLRFLLLLRDDIMAFINYHLENDSLRAFVEKDQKGEYMTSLSHGIGTYEGMINNYINELQNIKGNEEIVPYLKIILLYLTYKLHLSSNITKFQSGEYSLNEILRKDKYSVKDFVKEFSENYPLILTFNNANYDPIDPELVEFEIQGVKEFEDELFVYPDGLMKEMVFEIIYNIRKYVFGRLNSISSQNKLKIVLNTIEKDDILYLIVENNNSRTKETFVSKQNSRFNNGGFGRHGLNLIYNCLYPLFGKNNIYLEIKKTKTDKYFRIWLPIKKMKE